MTSSNDTSHNDAAPSPASFRAEAEALALDILNLSRNTLMVHLRFLQPAFCALEFSPDPETTLATDGTFLYYQFLHILRSYRIKKELVMRDYLHTVLHCIFRHPFVGEKTDPDLWNLSCDIAVEAVITELNLPDTDCPRTAGQSRLLEPLKKELPLLSAEAIYHHFKTMKWDLETIFTLRDPFLADDHHIWYHLTSAPDEQETESDSSDDSDETKENQSGQKETADLSDQRSDKKEDPQELSGNAGNADSASEEKESSRNPEPFTDPKQRKKQWQDISARVQTDLETTSRQWGKKAGSLLAKLQLQNREKTDYSSFLRQFAVWGEEVTVNDEEFDYIFYTYGLKLYDNMPLVEPLEYREVKKIREFVIAIDTSASVRGETAESFLRKTCGLLLQEGTWFSSVRLHVIQCDSVIQSDTLITCREDLDHFLEHLELKGFGGTDFRPVFSYIEKLQKAHQLTAMKGLLYFTDGDGIYPDSPPPYKTAFLFPDRSQNIPPVPVWAIKAILDTESLNK